MKKNGSTKAKVEGSKEDGKEDVEHAFLRVLGADFNDLLAVRNGSLLRALKLNVGFDELHRAISSSSHGLHRCAGEPVNHRAARDQAQKEWSMKQRELLHIRGQSVGQRHDDGEDHRRRAYHRGSNQHWLSGRLNPVRFRYSVFNQLPMRKFVRMWQTAKY